MMSEKLLWIGACIIVAVLVLTDLQERREQKREEVERGVITTFVYSSTPHPEPSPSPECFMGIKY